MLMHEWMRVLKYDGANFTDLSLDNQDETTNVDLELTTTDYIYIAQYFPFNNLFLYAQTANVNAAAWEVQYWTGRNPGWVDAVDILDGTSVGGVTLSRPGVLQWDLDREFSWIRVPETDKNYAPTELQALKIYELYWIRLRPKADLSAGTNVRNLTYAFTTSQQLDNLDIKINNFLPTFGTGKTDWNDQIITASKQVVTDLKRQGLVTHPGQVLRFDDLSYSADLKTLELIYSNLGPSYEKRKLEKREQYLASLNVRGFTFDTNFDGKVSRKEIESRTKMGVR